MKAKSRSFDNLTWQALRNKSAKSDCLCLFFTKWRQTYFMKRRFVHCGTLQSQCDEGSFFSIVRCAEKIRVSYWWVAVPQIFLHMSITSSLKRQLSLNTVIWYKCLFPIHGIVSSRENLVLINKHGNIVSWCIKLSCGERHGLKCGFNKNWHTLKETLDNRDIW
jgi:hypothetical protein